MIGLFAAAIFASAFLLFWLEPMVGKMALPFWGGAPSVWIGCMFFFQGALLAGYAYAHHSQRLGGARWAGLIHLALLAAGLIFLPPRLPLDLPASALEQPTWHLLESLLLGVGPPFFLVSAGAPLLQRWLAATSHPRAADPYFLYAASNLGSFLGLLGYPLLLERVLDLEAQARLWSWGYGLMLVLLAACWLLARAQARPRTLEPGPALAEAPAGLGAPSGPAGPWFWVFCSLVPSSLMLSVTAHITCDLAAIPLFWVIPLALYLLSFVLAFSAWGRSLRPHLLPLTPGLLILFTLTVFIRLQSLWMLATILVLFFLLALVCHGELYHWRPPAPRLTEFYLWISLGGVLGGLANAVIAPLVFDRILEFPLFVVLAGLVPAWSQRQAGTRLSWRLLLAPSLLVLIYSLGLILARDLPSGEAAAGSWFNWARVPLMAALTLMCLVCLSARRKPLGFALSFVVLVAALYHLLMILPDGRATYFRNFFGVLKVMQDPDAGLVKLVHGTTVHGLQSTRPGQACQPLSYYHRLGPLGDVFTVYNQHPAGPQVGVVGLGAGSIACYARPGQLFTFYEIDPQVADLARDPRRFTYLTRCIPDYKLIMGDARLRLTQAKAGQYGLLILDAFTSDAIPVHLLTRQAVEMYLVKLAPGGLLAFHVSNNYLELRPVVARLGQALGLACLARHDPAPRAEQDDPPRAPSTWAVLARPGPALEGLAAHPGWQKIDPGKETPLWTDQYSNLLQAAMTKALGGR